MPIWTLWQWALAVGLPACVLMQLLRGGPSPAMMLVRGLFEWFVVGVASFCAVLVALWLGGIVYTVVRLGLWLYLAAAGFFVLFCVWTGLVVFLRRGQGQRVSEEERAQRRKARAQEITDQIIAGMPDVNQPVAPAPPLSATSPSSSAPADSDDWISFWSWARKVGLHSRLALDKAAGRSTTGMTPREIRQAIEDRERHSL